MATSSPHTLLTDRDHELLAAIDRSPLTVDQLLKISSTFAEPFGSSSRLRGRLAALLRAGWVRRWSYAAATRGTPADYYRLTLAGFRLLYGPDARPPTRRAFAEIGLAHQHHTRSLADFIVHTVVSAHRHRLAVADFYRENTLRLVVGEESVLPDCAFRMRLPQCQLNFVVELDNGTERVRSEKEVESWERKIRLYDAYQDRVSHRFRVLIVTTRSGDRLQRILDAAGQLSGNPQRRLFYGIHLADFLRTEDAVAALCFRDHTGRRVSLVPPSMSFPEESLHDRGVAQVVTV